MTDPRQSAKVQEDLAAADAQVRPAVARAHAGLPTPVIMAGFGALGVGVFLWMASHRADAQPRPPRKVEAVAATALTAPAAPPAVIPGPQFTENNSLPPPPAQVAAQMGLGSAAPLPPTPAVDLDQRRRAPTLVVDFGGAPTLIKASAETTPSTMMGKAAPANTGLNPDETFADRLSAGDAEPAKASAMRDLDALIPQGAVIPAVMETAINSDLPGLARAMVARDIKSFDGSTVLIPRGSRVIGQYRNAQALGESRVFVIWSRLIRPDGVSVQLGSPGGDALGRGGLTGEVNTHFFARFGDAIMMSVLNAGVGAATGTPSTQISIGSSAAAVGAAAAASMPRTGEIPPTIKVPQGAEVTIFIARDLDFSAVKALP
jgi:type IV secretion system protein VirB10